jgi:hypothetical protein
MMSRRFLVGALVALFAAPVQGQAPAIVGVVDFEDTPSGVLTGIAKDRYRHLGVVLGCSPGHWLHTVERDGPHGYFGRSLAVSPGGTDLYISVEFVVPGTMQPGAVQATDIQSLDAARRGYEYAYFDIHGRPANSGGNWGDYRMGEGWYYSNGPVAHRFVFHVGTGAGICLDNIRFSAIAGGSVAVESTSWSAVRALYR